MSIREEILERINNIRVRIAQAIHDGDWPALGWNVALIVAIVMVAVALAVVVLALVWKILGTLLGKIFAVPLVLLFILGLSYKMNRKERKPIIGDSFGEAEEVYEYVRDAMFLVFRAVSEYTNIVMPARASAIEFVDNPYIIEEGFTVFNFLAKTCGPIDIGSFKIDLTRTLRQMHRAHELNGIPRDLTEINGSYYCPLQIFGKPQDFGDYVQVSVVFATEQTIKLTRADRILNLDNIGRTRRMQGKKLTDDEL